MRIDTCPITGSSDSFEFLNLGNVPLVNNLLDTKEESLACESFPLSVQVFRKSNLACLREIVNKDKLFLNYVYQSGVNKPFLWHCQNMFYYLDDRIDFKKGDLILDIGGNDGSLLIEFKKKNTNLDYVNIDASQSFIDINKKAGIRYVNEYFDENFLLDGKKASLITSTNVFQHTYPIRSFVKGVYNNLNSNGIWSLEFPYLLTTLLNDNYDQVYHEHVYYFLLKNIVDLLDQEGMKVVDVSFHDIHSGTLRVLSVKKTNPQQPNFSVQSFLNLEKASLTEEYFMLWGKRTHEKVHGFIDFIADLRGKGARIACFGAAAKGCVFLNTCHLDYKKLLFIVDDTPFKQHKFVPGTGLQVVGREMLKIEKVDYLIILAHNFKDYIMSSLKGEYEGRFIIMFPDIKII